MLEWSVLFALVSVLAGGLGFAGLGGSATSIAKVLFWIFVCLFLLSFFVGRRRAH